MKGDHIYLVKQSSMLIKRMSFWFINDFIIQEKNDNGKE